MKENLTIDDLPNISEEERNWWSEHNDEYYHYFYRIDNIKNGMFYYGIHSQRKDSGKTPETDGYMGSGSALNRAQKEEGMKNFKKTIIKTFSTRDEARLEEMKIVDENLVNNDNCYNISLGGAGTNIYSSHKYVAVNYKDPSKKLSSSFLIPTKEYNEHKDLYATNNTGFGVFKDIDNENDIRMLPVDSELVLSGQFVGVTNGRKQSKQFIQNKLGEKNGSYGTMWITNNVENRKIKKRDNIPEGWRQGKVQVGNVKYRNINTGEEKLFLSTDIIPDGFLPDKFFDRSGKLISESELYKRYKELSSWENVSYSFNRGRKSIEELLAYYKSLKDN